MSLTNGPDDVVALRDMLLQTTDAVASASMYYPAAAYDPDAGTADSLPAWLLAREDYERSSYAAGAQGLPGGSMSVTLIYPSASYTIGLVEAIADRVCRDLMGLAIGLPITSATSGRAMDATPGTIADDTDTVGAITCTIEIQWGLQ